MASFPLKAWMPPHARHSPFRWFFKALSEYMVVLFQQYTEIYTFSPIFPLMGSVIGGFYWLFLWSSKGITNKMFWLWIPPMGKSDKKAVFSACCGDETATYHDRAFGKMQQHADTQGFHSLPIFFFPSLLPQYAAIHGMFSQRPL